MRKKDILELLGGKPSPRRRAPRKGGKAPSLDSPYPTGGIPSSWRIAESPATYGSADTAAGFAFAAAEEPFNISAVETLATRLSIPADDLMTLLGIGGRTAQRRWQEGKLTVDESDRLYRVARIFHRAIEVLESETSASRWLKRSQAIFSGAPPLALLGSDAGAKAVEEQLGRIDHGIFA